MKAFDNALSHNRDSDIGTNLFTEHRTEADGRQGVTVGFKKWLVRVRIRCESALYKQLYPCLMRYLVAWCALSAVSEDANHH